MDEQDRRSQPRVPVETEVQLVHNGRVLPAGISRDLSEGGIGIDMAPAPIRAPLKVFLTLPRCGRRDKQMLLLKGSVVWSDDAGSGLRFVDPPEDALTDLRCFIDDQLAPPN